jgi:hypothetical protein
MWDFVWNDRQRLRNLSHYRCPRQDWNRTPLGHKPEPISLETPRCHVRLATLRDAEVTHHSLVQ